MMEVDQLLRLALRVCEAHDKRMRALHEYSGVFIEISEAEGGLANTLKALARQKKHLATDGDRIKKLLGWAADMVVSGPKSKLELEAFVLMFGTATAVMVKYEPSCRFVCQYIHDGLYGCLKATKA